LQAILEHFDRLGDRRGGDVVVVVSDRENAGALERARRRRIPTTLLPSKMRTEAPPLDDIVDTHQVDFIVLTGFLRLVPDTVVRRFVGRIVNVHPALSPAFSGHGMYGQHVHKAVIESGVRVTGVTAHFVDEVYDRGRIITQWPVPVFPSDDAGTLAARVLRVEHLIYPRVVDAVASGRTTLASCATRDDAFVDVRPSFTLLPHEDSRLAENIDLALGC
jgi:phosphoribosylglycinamide formyltransferase 1